VGFGSEASDLGPLIMCHEVMDVYLLLLMFALLKGGVAETFW
jgi:hypothetical protein